MGAPVLDTRFLKQNVFVVLVVVLVKEEKKGIGAESNI
jgi:hypothetical protein